MNEVSITLNFLIAWFRSQYLVNTVTLNALSDLDQQKENIYMLVNLDYKESDPGEDKVTSYLDLTILQQRNVSPDVVDSKLQMETNLVDNLNETFSVFNKFVRFLEMQNNDANIELDSYSRPKVLKNITINGLDGYRTSIAVSVPNKTSSC